MRHKRGQAQAAGPQPDAEALCRLHGDSCYALAYRILGDERSAIGVLETVFTTAVAWDHCAPGQTGLADRLLTLTRGRALESVRLRRGDATAERRDADEPGAAPTAGLLAQLPVTEREVVSRAYFGGYTLPEIADQLGLATPEVKTRVLAGMRTVQRLHAASGGSLPQS